MPRRRSERYSRYQLSLDVELERVRQAEVAAYRAAALELAGQAELTNRFVRILSERIAIQTPADAASYLQTQNYIYPITYCVMLITLGKDAENLATKYEPEWKNRLKRNLAHAHFRETAPLMDPYVDLEYFKATVDYLTSSDSRVGRHLSVVRVVVEQQEMGSW